MRPSFSELQKFAIKTIIIAGALTVCVGVSYAATTIGTNISTDGTLNVGGDFGIAASSPGSTFSIGGITNFTSATSTFYSSGGINLAGGGCFAVNGTCVGAGGSSLPTVTTATAAGSSISNATQLSTPTAAQTIYVVTIPSSGTGVILPPSAGMSVGQSVIIVGAGGSSGVYIYPHGSDTFGPAGNQYPVLMYDVAEANYTTGDTFYYLGSGTWGAAGANY
jgi:hypothetical protein